MNNKLYNFFDKLLARPIIAVIIIAGITIFFAFQLPRAQLDNNNIRFVPVNDEARITSKYIDDTFGSSLFILIGLERKYGDVFDPGFLNRIRDFNSRMGDIQIAGNVNSIVSSDYIFAQDALYPGEPPSITVQKLVGDDFTGTPEEIAVLKQRLLSWDIYRRALISDDYTSTQIMVPLNITSEQASSPEVIDQFSQIRDIAKEMFKGYADVYVTGIPIISATINEAMRSDLITMIPIVILVVLLILFFSFRNITAVILPLIAVAVAVIWSVGAMPLVGIKLSVVSSVLPVILVAVGSSYGIHIVLRYLEGTRGIAEMSRAENRVLVLSILGEIGRAVFLAAITTIAGFISFCFTSVMPIREFGYFSSFGVLISFITAVTLIPALLILRGPKLKKIKNSGGVRRTPEMDSVIAGFFTRIAHRKSAVIFIVVLVVLFSIWGISKVVIDNIFVEYFKTTTDIYRSDEFIREKFGGSKIVSVVTKTDSTEALLMPDVLLAVDKLAEYLDTNVPEVGKVMGFTDLVKRINQVFNADESPDGLRPAAPVNTDTGGFGFGDFGTGGFDTGGFGFGSPEIGDFGFGSQDTGDFTPMDNTELKSDSSVFTAQNSANTDRAAAIDTEKLVTLLREAASSGKNRSMDAGELVRELEKLINYEGASYYEIPADPSRYGKTTPDELSQLVANYLVLLSGNISEYANDPLSPTAIKTTVQLRTLGDKDTGGAIDKIRNYISVNFPKTVDTIIGGTAMVESSLNRLVVQSQISSVVVSILVVFFLVALTYRSFTAGIVIIAPLSIGILFNLAIMGFAGIKLNIGTSMMASLSMSIGIDYTIHYVEAYKREYLAANGQGDFLFKTFTSSGKAILVDSISTGAGFAVLVFSQFVMLQDLGFLIALAMLSSALVGLTVIPVLLSTLNPKFIRRGL
ncbi:MAG: MMPL family transporter [Treponema sp.]|nr:MMPL family transporter [Treponema sp.]